MTRSSVLIGEKSRGKGETRVSEKVLQGKLLCDVGICDHGLKLFEIELAVSIGIGLHNGLIDDLLQLLILQVVADHHLEHQKQLAVANQAVAVHIVHLEGEPELFFARALIGEGREAGDKLLKIDGSAAVLVKDGDQTECQRVVGDLRDLQEFVLVDRAGSIAVELHKALFEPLDLFGVEVGRGLDIGQQLRALLPHLDVEC